VHERSAELLRSNGPGNSIDVIAHIYRLIY